ncbi:MAG: hypothetical protein WCP53_13195 [Verrucomicrobiota bacterium]
MKPNKLALALQQIRTDLATAMTDAGTASHLEKAALVAHRQAKADLKSARKTSKRTKQLAKVAKAAARKASKAAAKLKVALKTLKGKASSGAKEPKAVKKKGKRPQAKREALPAAKD